MKRCTSKKTADPRIDITSGCADCSQNVGVQSIIGVVAAKRDLAHIIKFFQEVASKLQLNCTRN